MLLPLAGTAFPPSTDLPQQLAQIRLIEAANTAEGSQASPYELQWWHPNKGGYVVLLLAQRLGGNEGAPRLAMAGLLVFWLLAIHGLAVVRQRPAAAAVVASLLVYNLSLAWGFVNFLVAMPIFLLVLVMGQRPWTRRSGPIYGLLWATLYIGHILWLAMAVLWLIIDGLLLIWTSRADPRRAVALVSRKLLWGLPVWILSSVWFIGFRATGVDDRLFWGRLPWQRLHPDWLTESLFGHLQGATEPLLVSMMVAWLFIGWWQRRGNFRVSLDSQLLAAGLLLVAAALVLPAVYHHTILFAARWLAPGLVLVLISWPAPRLLRGTATAWALGLCVLWSGAISSAWWAYNNHELRGFEAALNAIPSAASRLENPPRIIGLDFVRTSSRVDGFPFHHLVAYAQLRHGGELNRTFADDPSSLVVFRQLPHTYGWTDRLDWQPEKIRHSDFDHFDLLIAHAETELHGRFDADPRLEPMTPPAPWRLYRIGPRRSSDKIVPPTRVD